MNYTKPVVVPLGSMATSEGQNCQVGSAAEGRKCQAGVAVAGTDNCAAGAIPRITDICKAGGAATSKCKSGNGRV